MRGEGDFPVTLEIVRVRGSGELKVLGGFRTTSSPFTSHCSFVSETDMCIMDAIRSNGGHAIHPTCWQPACVQRSGRVHCRIRMRRHESRHERVQGTPSLLKRAEVTQ
jgi:hypothetical protein